MNFNPGESWTPHLAAAMNTERFRSLASFVREAYAAGVCHPSKENIFSAFRLTPFESVKVVIVGQDPYHGENQAHGLAFSVLPPTPPPPSLKNIFREIADETTGRRFPSLNGDLTAWAKQGVLLLNSVLTVADGMPGSHAGHGWEEFTDAAINALSNERNGLVFMLWGSYAAKKGLHIDRRRHLVLTAPHPSPLSAYRGFFGCGHFVKANAHLASAGIATINWEIPQ